MAQFWETIKPIFALDMTLTNIFTVYWFYQAIWLCFFSHEHTRQRYGTEKADREIRGSILLGVSFFGLFLWQIPEYLELLLDMDISTYWDLPAQALSLITFVCFWLERRRLRKAAEKQG